MKKIVCMLCIVCLLPLSACSWPLNHNARVIVGKGALVTNEYPISAFSRVEIQGVEFAALMQKADTPHIHLHPSQEHAVIIRTNEDLLSEFTVKVEGDTLLIAGDPNVLYQFDELSIDLYFQTLSLLTLTGGFVVDSDQSLVGTSLDMDVAGAAQLNLDIQMEELRLTVGGAGDVTFSGKTDLFVAYLMGAGNLRAFALVAQDVSVDIAGAGNCELNAQRMLGVTIAGIGNVTYVGDPDITQSISGLGSVKAR